MDGKKTFWIIAVIVALAGIAATVAYFVTRYISNRNAEFDDFCDCDCLDDICADECDCCSDAQPAAE